MTDKKRTLSIIVPAYNEEKTLAKVVCDVSAIAGQLLDDYEVVIVNDASTDKTGGIADMLARENPHVRAHHNPRNMNLGFNFKKGIELASKNYICLIPADDDITYESLEAIIGGTGKADLVLAYHASYEMRHPLRRWVSKLFVVIMNLLFGFKLKYYNGPVVIEAHALRGVTITTFGFASMAEIVVTLLKCGYSYIEVPMKLNPDRKGVNLRVFRPRNVASVLKTITMLFWNVRIIRKY